MQGSCLVSNKVGESLGVRLALKHDEEVMGHLRGWRNSPELCELPLMLKRAKETSSRGKE